MDDEPSSLIIEHLKALRTEIAAVKHTCEIRICLECLGQVEIEIAGLRRDFAHADENTASLSVRLDRPSSSTWNGSKSG